MNEILNYLDAASDFMADHDDLADNLRSVSISPNGAMFTVVGDSVVADQWQTALASDEPARMPETIENNGQLLNEVRSHPFKVFVRRPATAQDWLRVTGGR